jgi:hypothetical protein
MYAVDKEGLIIVSGTNNLLTSQLKVYVIQN